MIPAELAEGELEILGLLPASSNYTFLTRVAGTEDVLAVYKPRKGETPLWDFPAGTLCQREAAAYLVSAAVGWDQVPPTVLRDGPLGPGAVQLFVDHDPTVNAFTVGAEHEADLKRMALFDLIVNNADRKAGHVLLDRAGRLWGVDHGLCFHVEPKLRTVLWDYVGDKVAAQDLADVAGLGKALTGRAGRELESLLAAPEMDQLQERIKVILQDGIFPPPGPGRPYPWPPI